MRSLVLLVPVLLLTTTVAAMGPGTAAPLPSPSDTQGKTACLGGVDAALCVTSASTARLACQRLDAGHVSCDAPFDWTSEGHSTALLPGQAEHVAGATLSWCPPGDFCRSYGVAFLIQSCSFGLPSLQGSCSDHGTYNLNPGPLPLGAGQCMDLTLDGFLIVNGYLVQPQLTAGRPVVAATTTPSATAHACN
jgi:hypothetical protein